MGFANARLRSHGQSGLTALALALCLGFVAGLRVVTPVAAIFVLRGGIGAFVWVLAAVAEYVVDAMPNTPSRTQPVGIAARIVSGGFVGWAIATMHGGSGALGMVAGIAGALTGASAGHAARLAAITRFGAYPAAIAEDLVAIGLAAFVVTR